MHPQMDYAIELAHRLLQIKAIQLSPQKPFTWASGLRTPIYCDNRVILSHPELRRFVIKGFVHLSEQFNPFNVVAGVATAGIAHGVLLAEALNLPFVYVRAKAKEHGRKNMIEGQVPDHANVLVVEDLISTGGSCLSAVEALRDAGAAVVGVAAVFSYLLPAAKEAFTKANCPLATLSHYDALIEAAQLSGIIPETDMQTLQAWRLDIHAWSSRHSD
jgi:orotate phosphoribosyltransferase